MTMSLTDSDIEQIRKMHDDLYQRFTTNALGEVNTRLTSMDGRFDSIDGRLDSIDTKLESMAVDVGQVKEIPVINENIRAIRDRLNL